MFMKEKKTMFIVIPLFGKKGLDPKKIPQTKEEVGKILNTPNQSTFLDMYGYVSLDAKGWTKKDKMYEFHLPDKEVVEPYYVAHRNVQLYDETYITWGFDKVTQIYDMKSVGYKMIVLPDLFMIHLNHSDLKGFKNWEKGYLRDERHNLKIGTSVNRWTNLPGLLTNSFYPQWLKSNEKRIPQCKNGGDKRLAGLQIELEFTRNKVKSIKSFFAILLGVFLFSLVTLLSVGFGWK